MKRRFWTAEDEAWLIALYPDLRSVDVAFAIGRDVKSVYFKAHKLGVRKSPEFIASEQSGRGNVLAQGGRAHRFVKGQAAWNKGLHYQPGGRVKESQFKRGQMPHNWKPVGHERVNVDGYREVKIREPKTFAQLHVLVWMSNFGRVPRGKLIVFKDRNKSNCDPSNLEAITRAENMRRNSYHFNYPKAVCRAIQLKGALQRQINKRTKHAHD